LAPRLTVTPPRTHTNKQDETDVKIFEIHGDGKVELNSFVPFRYNPTAVAATSQDTPTQMIAVAGRTAVKLYRYETLDFRGGLYGHERTVNDVKFSSTGKEQLFVATVSNDMMLKVDLCAFPCKIHDFWHCLLLIVCDVFVAIVGVAAIGGPGVASNLQPLGAL
jgi:hypothetical protein